MSWWVVIRSLWPTAPRRGYREDREDRRNGCSHDRPNVPKNRSKAQKAVAAKPEFKGTVQLVETGDFVRKPEDSPHRMMIP